MIDLTQKKILVTGAHGFLGRHLVQNLREKRRVPEKNLFLPHSSELDLKIFDNCKRAVQGQDIVIHLAANVGGIGYNQKQPGTLFFDNAVMGIQLIEAARLEDIEKFVVLGTICAYPKFTHIPFKEDDIWNGYPDETNAAYGLAKKMLLVHAQAYRKQYGMNIIYLLPANMYGPGDHFEENRSHVIAALIAKIHEAQIQKKTEVIVWGSGNPTREFLYIKDAAEGILSATEKYDKEEPVNIGTAKEISISDLITLIARLMNFESAIRFDKEKPDGQPRRTLSTERAEKEFNFHATVPLEEGLRETIAWYRNNARRS